MKHNVIFIEGHREGDLHSVGIHTMTGTETDSFVTGPIGYVCTTMGYLKRATYTKKESDGAKLLQPEIYFESCEVTKSKDLPTNVLTGKSLIKLVESLNDTPDVMHTIVSSDRNIVGVLTEARLGGGPQYRKAMASGKGLAQFYIELFNCLTKKRKYPIQYVSGGGGVDLVGSSKASFLALIGTNIKMNMKEVFPVKCNPKYWSSFAKKNPLLALRYIVISTMDPDKDYIRLATPDKDIYNIGKVAGSTCYGVAKLRELGDHTDLLIDEVYDKIDKSAVVLIDINAVYNKATSSALHQYNQKVILNNPSKNYRVRFIKDDIPLVEQVSPTNMTLRGFEQTTLIKEVLEKYINNELDPDKEEHFINVTSQIYNDKGKVLPEIRRLGGVLNLTLHALPTKKSTKKKVKIKYKLGNSLPTLNSIGQLGSQSTKVIFVAWYDQGSNIYSHILIWDTQFGYAAFGNTDTNKLYI